MLNEVGQLRAAKITRHQKQPSNRKLKGSRVWGKCDWHYRVIGPPCQRWSKNEPGAAQLIDLNLHESHHIRQFFRHTHTLWFRPWTTPRPSPPPSRRRSHTKQPRKAPEGRTKALANTWNRARADRSLFFGGESIVLCRWPSLNGKKGSNFSPGLCGCQKIGFWLTAQWCTAPAAS